MESIVNSNIQVIVRIRPVIIEEIRESPKAKNIIASSSQVNLKRIVKNVY